MSLASLLASGHWLEVSLNAYEHWSGRTQKTSLSSSRLANAKPPFDIVKAQALGPDMYIELKKRGRTGILNKGESVIVVDSEDGGVMGYFEIESGANGVYQAKAQGSVDTIWKGNVIQNGVQLIHPNMTGYSVS